MQHQNERLLFWTIYKILLCSYKYQIKRSIINIYTQLHTLDNTHFSFLYATVQDPWCSEEETQQLI